MKAALLCFFTILAVSAHGQDCTQSVDMEIISFIESNHDPKAFNPASPETTEDDSHGQWQITRVALMAYNQVVGTKYTIKDLYNAEINRKVAFWVLYSEIPRLLQVNKKPVTVRNVIICYNAGIWWVVNDKYTIPLITQNYIKKYYAECAKQLH